jgi:homoserine kinase type II
VLSREKPLNPNYADGAVAVRPSLHREPSSYKDDQVKHQIADILSHYPDACQPPSDTAIQSLENAGGFSGASFWRWRSPAGDVCLRQWPVAHPNRDRLDWIHRVISHAQAHGITFLPVPLATRSGRSYVSSGGRLWELTAWMPGQPASRPVSDGRIIAAFTALARLHNSSADLAIKDFGPTARGRAGSPGIGERHEQLIRLVDGEIHRIRSHCRPTPGGEWNELCPLAVDVLDSFDLLAADVDRTLCRDRELDVRIQPCVRDVRREHILFTGDSVTGVVDLGSMRSESVAADISRLLVELCGTDPRSRRVALASYEAQRRLDDNERRLMGAFEVSGTLLGAINWLAWIFVDGRRFPDREAVVSRFGELAGRLAGLAEPFDESDEAI